MELIKNVLLVDDHLVVRKGIEIILKSNFKKITIYNSEDYLQMFDVLNSVPVDLIFLDINIHGIENIKIMKEIQAVQNNTKILIFSTHDEKKYGLRFIQNGADGYLNKFCNSDTIINAVNEMFTNGSYYSNEIRDKILSKGTKKNNKTPIDSLSNREFEIAQLLINGYGNLEISNKLDIQMSTVSTYKNRIFEKLDIFNVVALADLFKENS